MEDEFFHYEQTRNGWVAVFQKLQKEAKERAGSQDDARKPMNMIRNRYRDVLPIDKTRVKLDNEDNDYINANLVTIEDVKRSYILTQGPLQHTCSHFWQMIWEQHTTGILMLNRCYERGMAKCYPYWPQNDEGVEFDNWRIELLTTEDADSYRLSHLKLINTSNDESRVILHFHYTRWPDFGVPKTPDVFLEFLYAVRNSGVLNEDVGPCVVHCSAGIGRTGTFCLVDICLKKIEEVNEINGVSVQSRLQDIRTQRLGLIQTPDQLRFSYIAILQGAIQLLHLVNSDSEEEEEREDEEATKGAESDDSEEETQGPSDGFKMTNGPAISIYGEPDDDDKPPPIPPRPPDTLPNYHQEMLRHSPSPPSSTSPSPPPPPPPTSLPPGPPVVHTHTNSSDDENQAKRAHMNEKDDDDDDDDDEDDIEEVLMRHGAHTTEETIEDKETAEMKERLVSAPAVPLHGREDSREEEEEKTEGDPFLLQGGGGRESGSPLPPPLPPKMYRRDPPPGIDNRPPMPLPVEAQQQQDKKEEEALINELTELEALVSPPTVTTTTEVAAPPVEENKRKDNEPSTSDDDIQLAIQRRRDQRAERGRRIAEQVKEMKKKTTESTNPPPSVPWLLVTLSLVVGYILYHVWNT